MFLKSWVRHVGEANLVMSPGATSSVGMMIPPTSVLSDQSVALETIWELVESGP